jgi:hypothetical protein
MAPKPNQSPFYSHFNVSADPTAPLDDAETFGPGDMMGMLRCMLEEQRRQSELLEELVQQMSASQRQRANELGQWKEANPYLAGQCRRAAEALGNVQTEFLRSLTDEITEHADDFLDGDFLLNEFVDRYGPRLAHLNGVLQVLSQLSSVPAAQGASS